MVTDRRIDGPSLEQELLFESLLEDLRKPNAGGVDIENAFNSLSSLNALRPQQAITVLELVSQNIDTWVRSASIEPIMEGLSIPLSIYGKYTQQRDDPTLKRRYQETSSTILKAVIGSNPEAYEEVVAQPLRQGTFEQAGPILGGVLRTFFQEVESGKNIWGDEEDDCEKLAVMLTDFVSIGDQGATEHLMPHIPVWFFHSQTEVVANFPDLKGLLDEAWKVHDPNVDVLIQHYLEAPEERENLKRRVLNGEFGAPTSTLSRIIPELIASKEGRPALDKEQIDEHIQNLWLDLIDKNRHDPKLRPIREQVMTQEWYWGKGDNDEVVYTINEAFEALGIRDDEEGKFVARYGEMILRALNRNLTDETRELDITIPTGGEHLERAKVRLGTVLREVRGSDIHLTDRLLALFVSPL